MPKTGRPRIRKMQAALRETVLLGITTNWRFLQDVLSHPDFRAGRAHTTWIDEEFTAWQAPQCDLPAGGAGRGRAGRSADPAGSRWACLRVGRKAASRLRDRYSPWRAA